MSIAYAGGTNIHADIDGSSTANVIADVKAQLVLAGWTATAATGGWKLDSAATPYGLQVRLYLYDGGTNPYFQFSSVDETAVGQNHVMGVLAARVYKIIANKYQFFLYLPNVTLADGAGIFVAGGALHLPAQVAPTAVTNATNATPIVISSTAHGMITGEQAYIQGVLGNTAANGLWTITRIDDDTFSLDTSVGNGTYTASTGWVGGPRKISRAIWAMSCQNALGGSWRSDIRNVSGLSNPYFVVINESTWNASVGGVNASLPVISVLSTVFGTYTLIATLWHGNRYVIGEPLVRMGRSSGADGQLIGQLWDAVVIDRGFTVDLEDTFDSHSWHKFGADASSVHSSLWVVIP